MLASSSSRSNNWGWWLAGGIVIAVLAIWHPWAPAKATPPKYSLVHASWSACELVTRPDANGVLLQFEQCLATAELRNDGGKPDSVASAPLVFLIGHPVGLPGLNLPCRDDVPQQVPVLDQGQTGSYNCHIANLPYKVSIDVASPPTVEIDNPT